MILGIDGVIVDPAKLLNSAVELSLDLLEKNGTLLPFCKALNEKGESIYYCHDSEMPCAVEVIEETVRGAAKREIQTRHLTSIAVCVNKTVRYSDSTEDFQTIKVEMHHARQPAEVYYFRYKLDSGKATVLDYQKQELNENLFF